MAGDAMVCPRGHALTRIVRDGVQRSGGRRKQRWRCTLPDGSFHRFLGVVSRTRATDETCTECENHIAPHEGPAAPAEFEYLIREIAGALVEVGQGSTYSDVAQRVRMRANIGKTSPWKPVSAGQTVAEWMADFVPIVSSRYEVKEWPAVIVLDSINFRWTESDSGKNLMLYSILAAYGYDADGKNGRLVKVDATPNGNSGAWKEFLLSLPGRPLSIVCDQDSAIRNGVAAVWGSGAARDLIHLCEHHLGINARLAMKRDKLGAGDLVWQMFQPALQSAEGWRAFERALEDNPQLTNTRAWAKRLESTLRHQTALRGERPPVYSNGAVEAAIATVRDIVEPRMFAYRNRARLNRMLELVRLSSLRVDNAADYATDIRAHLVAAGGRMPRTYREMYDKRSDDFGGAGFSSLWSMTAQVAMGRAREKRARIARERAALVAAMQVGTGQERAPELEQ